MNQPADHPEVPPPRIGVLLINLGTPDAPEAARGAALSRRIPERPARGRDPADRVAADPPRHHPAHPPEEVGARLSARCGPRRARRSPRSPRARPRRCSERLGDAVIVDHAMRYGNPGIASALERMIDGRLRRASSPRRSIRNIARRRPRARNDAVFAALAAMRWQPALRTLPPYYDDPLYIDALRANLERQLAALDFEPRAAAAELPRHAAADARARRSLSLPLPEDRAAARRSARPRGRRRLPVALRPRQMARAGDRRDARRLSGARRQAHRHRRARLFRRLPRNARGARHPRPRHISRRRRRRISRGSIASTIAPKGWPCWNG